MSGVMRTAGQRVRAAAPTPRAADLRRRRAAALAPLGEAAHPALPVPRRGRRRVPPHRPADHAPPRARLPGRPVGHGARGRVPVRPDLLAAPVLDAGRDARDRCTCRAATGSTSGARPRYRESDGGLSLGRRACSPAAASVTLPAPLGELPLLARAGTLLQPAAARRGHARRRTATRAPVTSLARERRPARAARVPARLVVGAARGRRRAALVGGPRQMASLGEGPLPREVGPSGVARDAPSSLPPVRRAAGRAPGLMELRRRHGRPLGELRRTPRRARGTHVRKRTHAWPPRRLTGFLAANRRTRNEEEPNMSDGQHPRTSRPSPGLGAAPGALLVSLMADPEQQRRNARAGRRRFFRRHRP